MKNIKKIIAIVIIGSVFGSCESLLEVEAENVISGDIYSSSADIERALVGAYYNLNGIAGGIDGGELLGGDFVLMSVLLGHANITELTWRAELGASDYENFIQKEIDQTPTNLRLESNWRRAYETINVVNSILANIENVDQSERDRVHGEALAIRGILYFELTRLWGPQYQQSTLSELAVPLILTPINSIDELPDPTRASVEDLYDQVEQDLENASSLLLALGKNGDRLSYYACQGYLAKMALQKNDFTAAITYCDNVINSGEYSLTSTPLNAFSNASNSTEDIYAVQQTLANNTGDRSTGTGITTYFSSLTESGLGNLGLTSFYLTGGLANSPTFEDGDLRGTVDNTATPSTTSDQITTAFYTNVVNNFLISPAKYKRVDHVLPVLRLAELYLIRAEARFELNFTIIDPDALSDLNTIRTRAGLNSLDATDFTSSLDFYETIVLEKNREFFLEGHLLHDLKRRRALTGDTDITVGLSRDPLDPELLLPIPQAEQDASGLD